MKIYSSPVDQELLEKFQKLLTVKRKYIPGTDSWYSFSKLKTNLSVFRNFPARILTAKISRISATEFTSVPDDHGWHKDTDVPNKSIRLIIPLTESGVYHFQMENSPSWKLESGKVYSIPATKLHRLIVKSPGETDFYCIVLDVKEKNGKTTRKRPRKSTT